MMKTTVYSILAASILLLSSCASSKFKTNGTDPSTITELSILEPVSYIHGINKGNQSELSDSLSFYSQVLWTDVIKQNQYRLPTISKLNIDDVHESSIIAQQTVEFLDMLAVSKNIQNVPVPPMVIAALDAEQSRYGLLSVHSGFTRRKGNYTGQILKSIGIGVLTMGMYYPVPSKSNSTLFIAIVDNQTSQPVFFKTSTLMDKEPLDPKVLNKQLDKLFKGYFW
jgi:hypothetical protein